MRHKWNAPIYIFCKTYIHIVNIHKINNPVLDRCLYLLLLSGILMENTRSTELTTNW